MSVTTGNKAADWQPSLSEMSEMLVASKGHIYTHVMDIWYIDVNIANKCHDAKGTRGAVNWNVLTRSIMCPSDPFSFRQLMLIPEASDSSLPRVAVDSIGGM